MPAIIDSLRCPWSLSIVLHTKDDGPVLASEPVMAGDLFPARAEAWMEACLRHGCPDITIESVSMEVSPLRISADSAQASGLRIVATNPVTGKHGSVDVAIEGLRHVAARASRRLVAQGILKEGDTYVYLLNAEKGELAAPAETDGIETSVVHAPLLCPRIELDAVLARAVPYAGAGTAEASGPPWWPLLFTRDAFERAERYARAGEAATPPVETGGMLVGMTCSCPRTGELFLAITDVIEVRDADQREFSLLPSSRSWKSVQAIVRSMRAENPALQLLGQAHGHNWVPAGPPCERCATAAVCARSTCFASLDDGDFMRAVFPRAPWALCGIAGSNVRRDRVWKLYAQRGGVLEPRPFHLIDSFDLAHPPVSITPTHRTSHASNEIAARPVRR